MEFLPGDPFVSFSQPHGDPPPSERVKVAESGLGDTVPEVLTPSPQHRVELAQQVVSSDRCRDLLVSARTFPRMESNGVLVVLSAVSHVEHNDGDVIVTACAECGVNKRASGSF